MDDQLQHLKLREMDILEKFEVIKIENPIDKIIKQIRDSIISGQLAPGDKLPSERQLSERFCIGRTYVRDAIKKLEFFGIVKTNPQSGTIIAGADISAMEGLLTNVIKLSENDFYHLVETRVLMEKFTSRQAAIRRTSKDIDELGEAFDQFKIKVESDLSGVNEDFNFHLKIAEASQNVVIKSLMQIIIPDIINIYRKLNVCGDGRFYKSLEEHRTILDFIIKQKPDDAEEAMKIHLKDIVDFSLTYKG
jgi:GntR family transcriptional repressor for pyruvate dehydrogenase complex